MTGEKGAPPPKADFSFFCYTLASQAMIFLGAAPNPVTGKTEADLVQAKYTIDLLEMLREKTIGNLADEETKVLMGFLFDLRMKYVEASRGGPAPSPAAGAADAPAPEAPAAEAPAAEEE